MRQDEDPSTDESSNTEYDNCGNNEHDNLGDNDSLDKLEEDIPPAKPNL
jgi:hypothetical protein